MNTQQKNFMDDNFYFPEYIISSSQTSIDTIWEIRVNWEKNVNTLTHKAI